MDEHANENDPRLARLVTNLRAVGLDELADRVEERGICGDPNPFDADLPPCFKEPRHGGRHKASWPEMVLGQAGLASMEWDGAGLDELRRRNREVQDVANAIRAGQGLDPLDPPDVVTGYQRRPPDAFTPKDRRSAPGSDGEEPVRFTMDAQTDANAERIAGQLNSEPRSEEDGRP